MNCKDCKDTRIYQPLTGPPEPCLTCCDPPVYAGGAIVMEVKSMSDLDTSKIMNKKGTYIDQLQKTWYASLAETARIVRHSADIDGQKDQIDTDIDTALKKKSIYREQLKITTNAIQREAAIIRNERQSEDRIHRHGCSPDAYTVDKNRTFAEAYGGISNVFEAHGDQKPTLQTKIKTRVAWVENELKKLQTEIEEGQIGKDFGDTYILNRSLRTTEIIKVFLEDTTKDIGELKS